MFMNCSYKICHDFTEIPPATTPYIHHLRCAISQAASSHQFPSILTLLTHSEETLFQLNWFLTRASVIWDVNIDWIFPISRCVSMMVLYDGNINNCLGVPLTGLGLVKTLLPAVRVMPALAWARSDDGCHHWIMCPDWTGLHTNINTNTTTQFYCSTSNIRFAYLLRYIIRHTD